MEWPTLTHIAALLEYSTPKAHSILQQVVTTNSSSTAAWTVG